MTTKSSKKLSKDNGWGGVLTDLEWDIYYGNPERLAKISAYPVWNPTELQSYAWCWMLLKPLPDSAIGCDHCANSLDVFSGRMEWWEKMGRPDFFWVNSFHRIMLSDALMDDETKANDKLWEAGQAYRKLQDEKYNRRKEAQAKKLGLTVEQEKLLKEYRHNENRYYKLEVRRANYLLRIQRELALLQQGSRFLEMPDEEFLEKFLSISNETRIAMSASLAGDLLGWLDTRRNILKFRKENEAAIKVIEEVIEESQARALADSPKSK